ncbi:MAG TPA: Rpn family recombination-promoting nuclease/putative transposase [Blastocatellia bacterium]|nr:Rpn family recombination-promoting nuclease/putative transposase [Blastocatellia bacterium]
MKKALRHRSGASPTFSISNPHDAYFKSLLGQRRLAAEFLRHYLPKEIVAELRLHTLEEVKDSFISDELHEYFSDLIWRVKRSTGAEAYVYLLLEHKSVPEKWTALQLLGYAVKLWEQARESGAERLPLIIPVVLYHGRQPWKISLNFLHLVAGTEPGAWRRYVPDFEYYLCDLSKYDDDQITGTAELQVGLLLMKYIFSRELDERLEEIVSRLQGLSGTQLRSQLVPLATYVAATQRDLPPERVEQKLTSALTKMGGSIMPTLLETWIQRGLQQGLQQGLLQGSQEGRQALVLRQLTRRFGKLSTRAQAQIRRLSANQLEQLGEALLDFEKVADLNAWLRQHKPER